MNPAAAFLGATVEGPEATEFVLGPDLHGAFGGVFGGGIAAATLLAARPAAGGRRPVSLHTTFTRTLTSPRQSARATTISTGRTLTTVAVELVDADGRLAAHATATFAADEALYDFDAAGPPSAPDVKAFDDGWELPVPAGVSAPVMDTLPLRITGMPGGGFAHSVRAPWPDQGGVAEAAAMVADYCAGVPVGAAVGREGTKIPVPNPDLSLRFCGDAWGDVLVGVGRLARIHGGAAATLIEVWTGPDDVWKAGDERPALVAVGLSSAVMLQPEGSKP